MSPIATLFRNRMRQTIETDRPRSHDVDWATRARDDAVMLGAAWLYGGLVLPRRRSPR